MRVGAPAFLAAALATGLVQLAWAQPALAYIGPGLGAGTIGVVLGILASVFIALFAILWYPMKRLFRKRRSRQEDKAQE